MKLSPLLFTAVFGSATGTSRAAQLRSTLPDPEWTRPLDIHGRSLQDTIPSECQSLFDVADTCVENNLPDCTSCPSNTLDPNDPDQLDAICTSITDELIPAIPTCCASCESELITFLECGFTAFGCEEPAPAPAPAPAPEPASNPSFCFSESATVRVLGQGDVLMKDLQIQDQVFTGTVYEPVYAFGHFDNISHTNFLQIKTTRSQKPLEITDQHLLYVADKTQPVPAGSINVGDFLHSEGDLRKVQKISSVRKEGLYAPLTPSGNLVVDGILTSTYIALEGSSTNHWEIAGGRLQVSHQALAHFYLTPFRMVCLGISSNLCHAYTRQGIPHYVDYGMSFLKWTHQQSAFTQILSLGTTMLAVLPLAILEAMVGPSLSVLLLFGVAMALIYQKKMKKQKTKTL